MTKPVIHMIGQGHLDPVWLWRWTEGRAEALATSQSAVDRLREYPDFHFVRGEAQVYEWIEQDDPALFAAIQALIEAGRWHLVNGMVIQPDMNLPGGESFVRQVLLGKAYMAEKFGIEPRIAYCVDSFGHAATLPMILRQCGFDAYVFMRPAPHEKELPANVFWWQAPDGSRILTFRIAGAYTTRQDEHAEHIRLAVDAMPPQLNATMCFFGVGNHGGGPTKAQIENVQQIAAGSDQWDVRFSDPHSYFTAIGDAAEALPTVAEELQFHAIGCYSVVSDLKRAHRQAENGLLVAERMAALAAHWADRPAPHARLNALWHTLCFNQFHDTLGGTSLKQATDDAISTLRGIVAAAEEISVDAGRAVAMQIDTQRAMPAGGGAVVIFNPSATPFEQYVEYEPWTDWGPWRGEGWGLLDETGAPVPYQLLERDAAMSNPALIPAKLLFRAQLPPLGYRLYYFGPQQPQAAAVGDTTAAPHTLENDLLRVQLDPASGNIVSCIDKESGREWVGLRGWNVAQVVDDPSDTWTHRLAGYGAASDAFGAPTFTVIEAGPLQASLLVERRFGPSVWLQQLSVRQGEREILIRNWLNWQGRWTLLKLAFDVAVAEPIASHDVPFGWIERPVDGREVPTHMWMDVTGRAPDGSGQTLGTALLNDGKYGCDVTGSVMRLTVLRSPPYAYHEPHPHGAKQRYDWIDQGAQAFNVMIRPHLGPWQAAGVVERARQLNRPPLLITMHGHRGKRPPVESLLAISTDAIELTACKTAEDGRGLIARFADRTGQGSDGQVRLGGQTFPLRLAPFAVATLRFTQRKGVWQASVCDMLERPLPG